MNPKLKTCLFLLLSLSCLPLLDAQTNHPPIYNEPPFRPDRSFVDEISKAGAHSLIPDTLAKSIVLAINKTIFPPQADPNTFLAPSWGVHSDHPQIIALAKEITFKHTNNYDKARAVHEWLATHIYYDFDAFFT